MNNLLDLDIQRFATSVGPSPEAEYFVSVTNYIKTINTSGGVVSSIYYKLVSGLVDYGIGDGNIEEFTATSNNHRRLGSVAGRWSGGSTHRDFYFNVAEIGAAQSSNPILDYICLHGVSGTDIYLGYHIDWKSASSYNYQVDVVLTNQTNGETYYETVWPSQQYQDTAVITCPVGNSSYRAHIRIIDNNTNTLIGDYSDTYVEFSVSYSNPSLTINNRKLNSNCSEVNYQCTLNMDDELRLDAITGYLYLLDTSEYPYTRTVVKQLSFGQSQVQNMCINGLTAGNTYEVSLSISAYDPQTYDYYYGTFSNQFEATHSNAECSGIRVVPHSTTADCYINGLRCYNGATITKVELHFSNYDDPNNPIELTFTSTDSDKFTVSGLTAGKSYFVVCDVYNSIDGYPMSTYLPNDINTQLAGNDLPFALSVATAPGGEKVTVTLQNNNYKVASIMSSGYINQLIGNTAHSEGWEAKTETTIERLFKRKITGTAYEEFFCENKSTGATTSFLVNYQLNNTSPDLKLSYTSNFGLYRYQSSQSDGTFPPYIITYRYVENYRAAEQYTVGSVIVCIGLKEGVFLTNTHNGPIGFNFYEGSNHASREITENGTYQVDIIARINGVDTFIPVYFKIDKIGQVLTESDFTYNDRIDDSVRFHKGMYLRPKTTTWGYNPTISTFSVDIEVLGIDSITNVDGVSLVSGETNTFRLSGSSNKTVNFTITASKDGKSLSHTYTGFIYEIGRQPTSLGISILYTEYYKDSNNVGLYALCYPTNHSLTNCYSYNSQSLLSKIIFYINNTEVSQYSTFFDSNLMTAFASVSKSEISETDNFSISMTSCKGSDLTNVITDNLKSLGYNATPDLTTNYYPGTNESPLHLVLPDGTVIDDATFIKPNGSTSSLSDIIKIIIPPSQ